MTDQQRVLVWATLDEAVARLLRHPTVLLLFVGTALLSLGVEQVMRLDPVPATQTTPIASFQVNLDGGAFAGNRLPVTTSLGAYYGLRLPWLLERTALLALTSLSSLGAVVLAIAAIDTDGLRAGLSAVSPDAFLRAAALIVGVIAGFGLFGGIAVLVPVLALPLILVLLFGLIRLFVALPLVVRGRPLRVAVRESWHRISGHGIRVLGMLLVLGLLSGLLADVPILGPALEQFAFVLQFSTATVVADLTAPPGESLRDYST